MIELTKRAIESLSEDSAGVQVDTQALYASAFIAPVAIYYASYGSLNLWRALQVYDDATTDIPKPDPVSCAGAKKAKIALHLAILLAFEGFIFYGYYGGPVVVRQCIDMSIHTLFSWAGLSSLLIACFCEMSVFRMARNNSLIPVMHRVNTHKKRAIFLAVGSFVLAACSAVLSITAIFPFVMAGLIYRFASRPVFGVRKGRISVRGVVLYCFAVNVLSASMVAILVFALSNIKETGASSKSSDVDVSSPDTSRYTINILSIMSAVVIAIVLRYEQSLTAGAIQLVTEQEETPVAEKQGDATPLTLRSAAVTVSRVSPSFSAPLFHIALSTYFLVHVPALILSLSRFQYLLTSADLPSGVRLAFTIAAASPPQLWSIIFVPLVVAAASFIRSDGKELWTYSEQWIIPHEVPKTEVVGEQVESVQEAIAAGKV